MPDPYLQNRINDIITKELPQAIDKDIDIALVRLESLDAQEA